MRWNDRIGRRIKLSDLHVLLAVAQSGSMAKGGQRTLHVPTGCLPGDQRTGTHPRCPSAGAKPARYRAHPIRTYHAQLRPRRIRRVCGRASSTSNSSRTRRQAKSGSAARRHCLRASSRAIIERLHRRYPRMVFSVTTTNADALLRDLRPTQPRPPVPAEIRSLCRRPSELRSSVRQPLFRGGRREEPMDAPTARRACQAHRRILGTSAVRHSVRIDCQGHLWRQGATLSPRGRGLIRPRNDDQSAQDGPLSGHPCRVRVQLSRQTSAHQEIAG